MNWPEVAQPDGYVTSMVGFSKKSTFSKAVYLCAASQLDTSKLDGLNEMFHKLDVDRSLAGRLRRFYGILTNIIQHKEKPFRLFLQ